MKRHDWMKRADEFNDAFKEALQEAGSLYLERTHTRDVTMSISDKMVFGEQSFVTFIFMKACRLVQCILKENHEDMHDELLDIINYCAALLAYQHLKRQEEDK